jgi:hypothetical protein
MIPARAQFVANDAQFSGKFAIDDSLNSRGVVLLFGGIQP